MKNILINQINKLKKEKNAVILVHNYQVPEIYEVADFIGDSLGLCINAKETDADIIVFCGVDFMAESAKILNPEKMVLHPEKLSECPMAQMVAPKQIRALRKEYPRAVVCSYVNTTAEVKAESDICCTSGNAVKVVNSLREQEVIFTPDKNLAYYVQTKTSKKIIPVEGYCYVHDKIDPESVKKAKEINPDAEVLVHPECRPEVIKLADAVCSTSQMVTYCKKKPKKEFIIVTECGMVNRLKRDMPEKIFYSAGGVCFQMKKITLGKVLLSLRNDVNKIEVPGHIRIKAYKALERMLRVK